MNNLRKNAWNIFAIVALAISLFGAAMGILNYSRCIVPPIEPQLLSKMTRLLVDGNADLVTLTAQGYTTQTNDILVVEQSDGTNVFTVDNDGAVDLTALTAGDGNITNVGDINADSVSPDATTLILGETDNDPSIVTTDGVGVAVTLGNDAADDFTIDSTAFVVEGDTGYVGIGTAAPSRRLHIASVEEEHYQLRLGTVTNYYDIGRSTADGFLHVQGSQSGYNDILLAPTSGNVGISEATPANTLSVSGTLAVGNDLAAIAGTYGIVIGTATTTPTMAADTSGLFVADVAGSAELFAVDEADNSAQLTPHNFGLFTPDENEPYPWSYYACNRHLGKCINADMAGAIRAIEELSGETFVYYEDMDEGEVISWEERQAEMAATTNAQRLAEAAAVLAEVAQVDATESYAETVTQPVSPTEYITETVTTYQLNTETGEAEEVISYEVTEVMETVETGVTLWRLRAGCRLDDGGVFMCPTGEEDAVYEEYVAQPMPEWMQERFITIILAPQDLSGLEKPEGDWKKLADVGSYAIWAGIGVEAEAGIELHETLWAMSPTEVLGALAVVQTRGESMYDYRVLRAIDMTVQQALARRDCIADYLDSLGKNTVQLRLSTTEHEITVAIVESLGFTMSQLWAALD